jgi:hypothetical protein
MHGLNLLLSLTSRIFSREFQLNSEFSLLMTLDYRKKARSTRENGKNTSVRSKDPLPMAVVMDSWLFREKAADFGH